MQKIIVVYKDPLSIGTGGETDVAEAIVRHLAALPAKHCAGITAHIKTAELPSDLLLSGSFDLSVACGLSLWIPSFEDLDALRGPLHAIGTPDGIYSVVESTPREYATIDWPEGVKSPGATLFARFNRRNDVSRDEFLRQWQEYSALSLRHHPLIKYHRNAVMCKIAGAGADWDAFVEERVRSTADLAPEKFYLGAGARERAVERLEAFVDTAGMRCCLLEEYLVRRPCWLNP